jgi:hypothetical protein
MLEIFYLINSFQKGSSFGSSKAYCESQEYEQKSKKSPGHELEALKANALFLEVGPYEVLLLECHEHIIWVLEFEALVELFLRVSQNPLLFPFCRKINVGYALLDLDRLNLRLVFGVVQVFEVHLAKLSGYSALQS